MYVSLDRGSHFMLLDAQLPKVAVHDLVIHKTAHDLIIGTHGRSIYKAHIEHLQKLTSNLLAKQVHLFDLKDLRYSNRWGNNSSWNKWYGYNEPKLIVPFYVKEGGRATLQLNTKNGTLVGKVNIDAVKGLNCVEFSLELKEKYLQAYTKELKKKKVKIGNKLKEKDNGKHYFLDGAFSITLSQNGESVSSTFKINPPKEKPERKPQKKTP